MSATARDVPRADPGAELTSEQVSELYRKLLERRDALASQFTRLRDEGRMGSSEVAAEAEEAAQRTSEQSISTDIAEHERAILREVDRALRKLDSGTYGVSEESGEPIGYARLAALPWARLSAEDQERLERESRRR